MNTHTAVEVFLGKPIEVQSEREFLARLQRDLQALGVSARILANLQVGRHGDRQVDFVVITGHRAMVLELKTYPGPIVSGPRNGSWRVRVGAGTVEDRRNPLEQALGASQHFSDELHAFAKRADVSGPTGPKFWSDLDAVACAFPGLPKDSTWDLRKHVELIGYDELLDRLQTPGPSVQWSLADWDRFGQHLNLYRADEDAAENLVRHAGASAIDAYTGLFREAHGDTAPIAGTAVVVDGTPAARPDIAEMLAGGSRVLLRGPSGTGKTLWARHIAVELAEEGQLPIWIEADMCDGSFLIACAQAVAPYTALNVNELLKAADVSGRAVAFIVDDFSKISTEGRRRLLDGLRTARVRAPGRGVLITDQHAEHAPQFGLHADVELLLPDDDGRRAVLAAYGHAELIDRCEAFATPLELSLAAQCAEDLGSELSHAELFDTYVDTLTLGDLVTRGGLRSIAARMTVDLRPFQRRGDVTRWLRLELGMSDGQLRSVFDCDLLVSARGRVSFRHEQFERFLAAEALLDETDPVVLSHQLNSPSATALRMDVVALEGNRSRLETLLSLCEDPDVLVSAANGQLGPAAAEVVAGVFVDALNDACARTTGPDIRLRVKSDLLSGCEWELPARASRAQGAQLSAIGRLLAEGTWIEGVDVLLRHTDELCARAVEETNLKVANALASQVFSETYVLALSGGLSATPLVQAATSRFGFGHDDPERVLAVVNRLLPDDEEPGLSALWIAVHLLRDPNLPLRVDVITRCVSSTPYHLRAAGLHLAEDRSRRLTDEQRHEVVSQIEALSTNNLMLNTARLEALSALGGVEPATTEEDIAAEIEATLSMQGDPQADQLAYGIISNQFENEFVGPYYEVVSELPEEQRIQLLAMALNGCEHGWTTDAFILDEIKDLAVPEVRDAVSRYVARFNPEECMSPQFAMQAIMRAIALLTRAGLPVPESSIGEGDPAWQSAMELISAAAGDEDEVLADAWERFAVEHPGAVASFVGKLKGVKRMNEAGTLLERLESTAPPTVVDALVDALEHPARVRPIGGHDIDLRSDIVAMLAEIGNRRAAETLRRFADDPKIGRAATEAVRAIEARS